MQLEPCNISVERPPALFLQQAKPGVRAYAGSSLLEGNFSEDDSHASFADALSSWRGTAAGGTGPPAAIALPGPGPNAAPGEGLLELPNTAVYCNPKEL